MGVGTFKLNVDIFAAKNISGNKTLRIFVCIENKQVLLQIEICQLR